MGATPPIFTQPPYPGADPREVCRIVVRGQYFSDWESVYVQQRWGDAWPIFRFVAAERPEPPELWKLFQIKPGDECTIYMGDALAVTGIVTVRQAAYDAHSHSVSIQGVGRQWLVWRGAILDKTQNHPGNYFQAVSHVMAPFGVLPIAVGALDPKIYKPPAHNETGESVFQFCNRIAGSRKVVLGADHQGGCLLIGEHDAPFVDVLIEGQNIKSCQCVISVKDIYNPVRARGQTMRSDAGSPADAGQQDSKDFISEYMKKYYSPLLVPLEHPVWTIDEVQKRAFAELIWTDGTFVEVTVVVYGWFTSRGALWAQVVGSKVIIDSPMAALVNYPLKIRSATLTQDSSSGTQTTLDLVAPWLLNDIGIREIPDDPFPKPSANPVPEPESTPEPEPAPAEPEPPTLQTPGFP